MLCGVVSDSSEVSCPAPSAEVRRGKFGPEKGETRVRTRNSGRNIYQFSLHTEFKFDISLEYVKLETTLNLDCGVKGGTLTASTLCSRTVFAVMTAIVKRCERTVATTCPQRAIPRRECHARS